MYARIYGQQQSEKYWCVAGSVADVHTIVVLKDKIIIRHLLWKSLKVCSLFFKRGDYMLHNEWE